MKTKIIILLLITFAFFQGLNAQEVEIDIVQNVDETDSTTAEIKVSNEYILVKNTHLSTNGELVKGTNQVFGVMDYWITEFNKSVEAFNNRIISEGGIPMEEATLLLDTLARKSISLSNTNNALEAILIKNIIQVFVNRSGTLEHYRRAHEDCNKSYHELNQSAQEKLIEAGKDYEVRYQSAQERFNEDNKAYESLLKQYNELEKYARERGIIK
jgi:hypothetical protein